MSCAYPDVLKSADAAGANEGNSTIAFYHNCIVQTPDFILEAVFTSFLFILISRL